MENEGRWFLIEHKKDCSSVFTVNSREFLKSINDYSRGNNPITCPTCLTPFHKKDSLHEFFAKYELLTETLDGDGFKIREIKTNIDFQNFDQKL